MSTVSKSTNAAITVPSQSSMGGLTKNAEFAGSGFVNSSTASMSSYDMEGMVKTGIDVKSRRKTMAAAREAAEQIADSKGGKK